jgi:hypothetical protein
MTNPGISSKPRDLEDFSNNNNNNSIQFNSYLFTCLRNSSMTSYKVSMHKDKETKFKQTKP